MEIDDRMARDLIVRDIEINPVVGAQPRGAPVDLHHFREPILDMEPVADLVRLADLKRDTGDDAAEQILGREAEHNRGDARPSEDAAQLSFRVITDAQDDKQSDQVNEERDDLAKEMWNRRAPLFLPVRIPEVAIEQGDEKRGA